MCYTHSLTIYQGLLDDPYVKNNTPGVVQLEENNDGRVAINSCI